MASGPPCSLLFLFLVQFVVYEITCLVFPFLQNIIFKWFVLFAVLAALRSRFVVGCLRVALALWFFGFPLCCALSLLLSAARESNVVMI
jgi:hypothetical protein